MRDVELGADRRYSHQLLVALLCHNCPIVQKRTRYQKQVSSLCKLDGLCRTESIVGELAQLPDKILTFLAVWRLVSQLHLSRLDPCDDAFWLALLLAFEDLFDSALV